MKPTEYEKNWAKTNIVEMIFMTSNMRVEGQMYKKQSIRVSDALSNSGDFILLTDVKMFSLNGGALMEETGFLALNKSSIQLAMEKENSRIHGIPGTS